MQFINELHKNNRLKIRMSIALLLLFVDLEAFVYLAYVIITEILRYMSRRPNMDFLNSVIVKIILIMILSVVMGFFLKGSQEDPAWAKITAFIVVAFVIEQPFKLFVKFKGDKRREKAQSDYENEYANRIEHEEIPQKMQYKVSVCPSCGYKNKIIVGEVESCEYCGCSIE